MNGKSFEGIGQPKVDKTSTTLEGWVDLQGMLSYKTQGHMQDGLQYQGPYAGKKGYITSG